MGFTAEPINDKQDALRSQFIQELWEKYRLADGKMIALSKSRYMVAFPRHKVVFNSTMQFSDITYKGMKLGTYVIHMCDIDLSVSIKQLKTLTRAYKCTVKIYFEYDDAMTSPLLTISPSGRLAGEKRIIDAFNVEERRD